MLNVNAVIMIWIRSCRISFTLIVLFPLLLFLGDQRVHSDLVCVTPSGMHFDLHLKGIDGDDSCGINPYFNNKVMLCYIYTTFASVIFSPLTRRISSSSPAKYRLCPVTREAAGSFCVKSQEELEDSPFSKVCSPHTTLVMKA
jgi:hypothetical protein